MKELDIPSLMAELGELGIALFLSGEDMKYRCTPGAMSDNLKGCLVRHKTELISYLKAVGANGTEATCFTSVRKADDPSHTTVGQVMWWTDVRKRNERHIPIQARFQNQTISSLSRAVRQVVEENRTLRSFFDFDGKILRTRFNPAEQLKVETEAFDELPALEAEKCARATIEEFYNRSPSMEAKWLFGVKIVSLPGGVVILAATAHHIIFDGTSTVIFLRKLRQILEKTGCDPMQRKEALQFSDLAKAEHDWLETPAAKTLLTYWRRWYGEVPVVYSPEKKPLVWMEGGRSAWKLHFDASSLKQIQWFAASMKISRFIVYLTVFCRTFARWSTYDHFTVRSIGDQRTMLGLVDVIGLILGADAIDVHTPPQIDFCDLAALLAHKYYVAMARRIPSLHMFPPGIIDPEECISVGPNRIPLLINYLPLSAALDKSNLGGATGKKARLFRPQLTYIEPVAMRRRIPPIELQISEIAAGVVMKLLINSDAISSQEQRAFVDFFVKQINQDIWRAL